MQKDTKVKITFLVILVGMVCMFTAVVTDHWAVLSPRVETVNITCEAAHFGLWKLCKKYIYINEQEMVGKGCGPISQPGDVNCSYFRHFNPGETSEIFEVKTQRGLPVTLESNKQIHGALIDYITRQNAEHWFYNQYYDVLLKVPHFHKYNISAAAIAVFSLAFMILGTICMLGSTMKGKDYLHKPAGMFYAFAGLCAFISVEVMRQSVNRMIESEETIWMEYYYSWSFACACAGFVLLLLSGIGLLLLSMPQMPRNPWETCMDAEPEQIE